MSNSHAHIAIPTAAIPGDPHWRSVKAYPYAQMPTLSLPRALLVRKLCLLENRALVPVVPGGLTPRPWARCGHGRGKWVKLALLVQCLMPHV